MSTNNLPNKPLGWKLLNLWYIPFFFIIFLPPFAFLYAGLMVKNKKWIAVSIISFIIGIFCLVIPISAKDNSFSMPIFFLLYLLLLVYAIATAGTYLRMLQEKQEGVSQKPYIPEAKDKKNNLQHTKGQQFIMDLNKWVKEVESPRLKVDIRKMIDLSVIAMKKDNLENSVLFERYDETVNKLLQKYDELENTRMNTKEMLSAMSSIEDTMSHIVAAFEKEIANMYKSDLLNIEAETTVFIQELKNKNLIE